MLSPIVDGYWRVEVLRPGGSWSKWIGRYVGKAMADKARFEAESCMAFRDCAFRVVRES